MVEGKYAVVDGETGRPIRGAATELAKLPEVSESLNLEEMSLDVFLEDLKIGKISETVLLKPETTPEEVNSSSVMDEDVLEEFTSSVQRALDLIYSRTRRIPSIL